MTTATITRADYALIDGVLLLTARCDTCGESVHHGGGNDLDDVLLGDRAGHCRSKCDNYELVDPNGVIANRMPDLRVAAEEHRRLAARRAARRAAA